MFDPKKFSVIQENILNAQPDGFSFIYCFYDSFAKTYGPLNVSKTLEEALFNSINDLHSVSENNISLSHVVVYFVGYCLPQECQYHLLKDGNILLFNGNDYKEVHEYLLSNHLDNNEVEYE